MRWLDLFLVKIYYLCVDMVLLLLLVLCDLYFFFTYGVSFGPLRVGYRAKNVFDSGWIEYCGGQGIY